MAITYICCFNKVANITVAVAMRPWKAWLKKASRKNSPSAKWTASSVNAERLGDMVSK